MAGEWRIILLGLGRSERYIDNRLKSGRAKYITEEEYHTMMAQRMVTGWEEESQTCAGNCRATLDRIIKQQEGEGNE